MAVTVRSGNLLLFTGDSITDSRVWFDQPGGLLDLINAGLKKIGGSPGTGFIAGKQGSSFIAGRLLGCAVRNTGVNGNVTGDIAADVPGRITNYNPDVVVILIGVNDVAGRVATATTLANMTTILSSTRASLPSAQIGVVSIMCYGEAWTAGPPLAWNNGVTDTSFLEPDNVNFQALCATYNATFIDIRTPLLAIEPTINPTSQNQAFTIDGVHPVEPASCVQMGTWAFPYFTVVP